MADRGTLDVDQMGGHVDLLRETRPDQVRRRLFAMKCPCQGGKDEAGASAYITAQMLGAFIDVAATHLMFGETLLQFSHHTRTGGGQLFSEFIVTFWLLCVIWGGAHLRSHNRRILVYGFHLLCQSNGNA